MSEMAVLIESDWNLKLKESSANKTALNTVLIESDWNLKSEPERETWKETPVLIESDWNLKWFILLSLF